MAQIITLEEYKKKKKQGSNNHNKKASHKKIIIIILLVFLVTIIMLRLINNNIRIEELEDQVNSQLKVIKNQKKDIDSIVGDKSAEYIKNKLEFYDKSVVYVIEGYGNYYYTYDCMIKKVGNDSFTYWTYNPEAARDEGYKEGSC